MNLSFDKTLVSNYSSSSQISRVLTETWAASNIFCPSCGSRLKQYENNKPVADLYCSRCVSDFELKSKQSPFGTKIADGAYATMIERLSSQNNPHFFLLRYRNLTVTDFMVIPRHYFTPSIIEKRSPLSPTARRAGWIGCNINIGQIPESGKIHYVRDSVVEPRVGILAKWKSTLFLADERSFEAKGWLLDVMKCVDMIQKSDFSLAEVYEFEQYLAGLHPENNHVKDKIRQQLQKLRDYGYIEFSSRGKYTKMM